MFLENCNLCYWTTIGKIMWKLCDINCDYGSWSHFETFSRETIIYGFSINIKWYYITEFIHSKVGICLLACSWTFVVVRFPIHPANRQIYEWACTNFFTRTFSLAIHSLWSEKSWKVFQKIFHGNVSKDVYQFELKSRFFFLRVCLKTFNDWWLKKISMNTTDGSICDVINLRTSSSTLVVIGNAILTTNRTEYERTGAPLSAGTRSIAGDLLVSLKYFES